MRLLTRPGPLPALLLLAATGLVATALPAAAQPAPAAIRAALGELLPGTGTSGLLLGFSNGHQYRTLYLTYRDGQVTLEQDLPLIVSPQADGFWLIDAETAGKGPGCPGPGCDLQITRIWADRDFGSRADFAGELRVQLRQVIAGSENGSAPITYHLEEWLDYVANGVVCVARHGEGYLGGAHPFTVAQDHCVPIAAPLDLDHPADLGRYVDPATLADARRRLQREGAAGHFEEQAPGPADLEAVGPLRQPLAFRLGHTQGQTRLTALGYFDAPYALSSTYQFTAAADLGPAPATLSPYNPDPLVMESLHQADPEIRDVLVAPDQNVVYALSADRLTAFDPATGRPLLSRRIAYDRLVMAEWALGSHVARWADTLQALAGH